MITGARIAEIKEEIQQHTEARAIAKSRLEDIKIKLKKDFDLDSIEDAEKLIKKLETEKASLQKKADDIESTIEELLEDLED